MRPEGPKHGTRCVSVVGGSGKAKWEAIPSGHQPTAAKTVAVWLSAAMESECQ